MNAILVAHLRRQINKSLNGHDATVEFDILDEYGEAFAFISDEVFDEIDAIVHNFVSRLDNGLTHAEKVCAVYYLLVNEHVCGLSETRFERNYLKYLKGNLEISKTHAILASRVLNALCIPNQIIAGNLNCEKHFWNLVQVNQKWFHLDATWSETPNEFLKYKLVSDEIMGISHQWDIERHSVSKFLGDGSSASFWDGPQTIQNTKRDYS